MEEVQVIEESFRGLVTCGEHDPWAGVVVRMTAETVQ
jgi:hypothetical protein